jgi:hypothetical protein
MDDIRKRELEERDWYTKRLEKKIKADWARQEAEAHARRAAWDAVIAACEGMDDTECWNKQQEHLARAERARKAWVRESNDAVKKEHGRVRDQETQAAAAALAQWEIRFTGRIVATPYYCGRKGWTVEWKPEGIKHGPFAADALYYASPAEAVEAATPVLQRRFPCATLIFRRPRRSSSIRSAFASAAGSRPKMARKYWEEETCWEPDKSTARATIEATIEVAIYSVAFIALYWIALRIEPRHPIFFDIRDVEAFSVAGIGLLAVAYIGAALRGDGGGEFRGFRSFVKALMVFWVFGIVLDNAHGFDATLMEFAFFTVVAGTIVLTALMYHLEWRKHRRASALRAAGNPYWQIWWQKIR